MKYMVFFSMLFILLLSSFDTRAELSVCYHCEVYSDFRAAAINKSRVNTTSIKVFNPSSGEIVAFDIEFDKPEPGFMGGFRVVDRTVTQDDVRLAQTAKSEYYRISSYFDADRNIPSDVLPSAYNLVGQSYNLSKVAGYYNSSQTLGSYISTYSGVLAALAGKIVNVNIVVNLKFADGTTALLSIDGVNANKNVTFKLEKVVDFDGNNVPLDAKTFADASGNIYYFSSESRLRDFLSVASRFGITIVTVNYTGSVSITEWTCNNEGGKRVCKKMM